MSNYAWANPTTGIREQSSTKEEARLLAWEELQKDFADDHVTVRIFEQERIGSVTSTSQTLDTHETWEAGYAWADPRDGKRECAMSWASALDQIQRAFVELGGSVPVDSVTVYRQRLAEIVHWNDPKPETPAPTIPESDTPQSLIEQVLQGTCGDLGRAQLLAMLWIAQSGMEIAGALHYMRSGPPQQRLGPWQRFKRWVRGDAGIVHFHVSVPPAAGPLASPFTDDNNAQLRSGVRPTESIVFGYKADPSKPHVYWHPQDGTHSSCAIIGCGKPLNHEIHGYTGD